MLDYFYFNVPARTKINGSFFEESMRLQNVEIIDLKKLMKMAAESKNKKLQKIATQFKKWVTR